MFVCSIPTERSLRVDRFWGAVRGFLGLMICMAGASAAMAFGGTEFLRFILPVARHWPEFFQFVVVMATLLASVALGWVVAFFAVVRPLRLYE